MSTIISLQNLHNSYSRLVFLIHFWKPKPIVLQQSNSENTLEDSSEK